MKNYEKLTEDQIKIYQAMLQLPNIDFPHYEHLKINEKIVSSYVGEELVTNEIFLENKYFKDNYNLVLKISNYGRVKKNGNFLEQWVEKDFEDRPNTFQHGLLVYINNEWSAKGVHRLVMETFKPIINMEKYEVHHLNNNGNDNRLENLIWVSKEDHRRIDSEFNEELKKIGQIIRDKNKSNFA